MKIFLVTTLLFSFTTFAETILNAPELTLREKDAVLVRTKDSPKLINLKINLEEFDRYCAEEVTVIVDGPAAECGTHRGDEVWVCYERAFNGDCVRSGLEATEEYNSCEHEETHCKRYERENVQIKEHIFKINFKKVALLKEGQTEKFRLTIEGTGRRSFYLKHSDYRGKISTIDTKMKYKIFTNDWKNSFTISKKFFQ